MGFRLNYKRMQWLESLGKNDSRCEFQSISAVNGIVNGHSCLSSVEMRKGEKSWKGLQETQPKWNRKWHRQWLRQSNKHNRYA